jgi:hypothetical protein
MGLNACLCAGLHVLVISRQGSSGRTVRCMRVSIREVLTCMRVCASDVSVRCKRASNFLAQADVWLT